MKLHDLTLTVIAFASEVLGTLSGFGSSPLFVPAALLLENLQFVLVLTGILHCFANLTKVILFRQYFDRRVFLLLAIPSIVFTGVGAWLVTLFEAEIAKRWLGGVLVVMGIAQLFGLKRFVVDSKSGVILLTAASGLATGYVGTGGAIRGIAMTDLNLFKTTFVSVSSAVDLGGDAVRTIVYLEHGFMDWTHWFYIPLLAAYAGARLGRQILYQIDQQQFEKIVAAFVAINGSVLLVS